MMMGPAELVPTARPWSGGEISNPKLVSLAVWSMPLKPFSPRTFPANPVARAAFGTLAAARAARVPAFFTNDGSMSGISRGAPSARAARGRAAAWASVLKLTVPTLVMCTAIPRVITRGWARCELPCAAVAAAAVVPNVAMAPAPMRAASARVRCCTRDPPRHLLMLLKIYSLSLHLARLWARGITEYNRKLTERCAYTNVFFVSIMPWGYPGSSGRWRPPAAGLASPWAGSSGDCSGGACDMVAPAGDLGLQVKWRNLCGRHLLLPRSANVATSQARW